MMGPINYMQITKVSNERIFQNVFLQGKQAVHVALARYVDMHGGPRQLMQEEMSTGGAILHRAFGAPDPARPTHSTGELFVALAIAQEARAHPDPCDGVTENTNSFVTAVLANAWPSLDQGDHSWGTRDYPAYETGVNGPFARPKFKLWNHTPPDGYALDVGYRRNKELAEALHVPQLLEYVTVYFDMSYSPGQPLAIDCAALSAIIASTLGTNLTMTELQRRILLQRSWEDQQDLSDRGDIRVTISLPGSDRFVGYPEKRDTWTTDGAFILVRLDESETTHRHFVDLTLRAASGHPWRGPYQPEAEAAVMALGDRLAEELRRLME